MILWVLVIVASVILDQITKLLVTGHMRCMNPCRSSLMSFLLPTSTITAPHGEFSANIDGFLLPLQALPSLCSPFFYIGIGNFIFYLAYLFLSLSAVRSEI